MKVAYADPPYFGLSATYDDSAADGLFDGIYDTVGGHADLIARLSAEYPDGWAMSLHSPSLRTILPLCPADCRVAAWVKPFASFKPGVNPAYAWEPMIWRGGRKRDRARRTVRDWVASSCTLRRGFVGAKPEGFCFWLFDLLGLEPGDEFCDLFPGSGAVGRAWAAWRRLNDGLFAAANREAVE